MRPEVSRKIRLTGKSLDEVFNRICAKVGSVRTYSTKVLPSDSRQSPSLRELVTESTGRNVATGTQVWPQPIADSSIRFARTRNISNDIVSSTHVEQAEARQSRLVQQTALQILAFQHCELVCR